MCERRRYWSKIVTMQPTSDKVDQPVWIRTLVAWHIAFWTLLGVTAIASLIPDLSSRDQLVYLGLLATLALGYQFVAKPAMLSHRLLPSHLYRLLMIVCVAGAVAIYPQSVFILFIVSPQIWLLSNRVRDAIFFSFLLLATVGAAQLWSAGWTLDAFWEILPWMLISLVVSMLLGIWIEKVITQSEQRAELIEQLEAARDELADAHHTAGVMAERERMAREIHDTLAQGMTSIVMLAQTAAVELSRGATDPAAARLAAIEDTARENLAEARALVAAFTPVALSGATLTEVLRRQAERFTAETGVDVQVSLDMPDDEVAALPQGQQVVLLRAAQESLANVRKHAGATRVRITLGMSADGVAIEISDDGSGFEPLAPAAGYGLAAMRGRVEESGGTVQVDSAPGRGTRVQVLVPATGQENS
ncbi:signal transduction histidine kinase [Kribbella orskensis]|uniref:Oxygen sensor histidine kinase NreB n=2 Tax=Kribbellaceae TaxID=2726069 RepID=A0ABY2BB58_9ACTN|nr:signal transduction histidine kinase [Kribbella sp. VKM Ac-2500]TCO14467.1 signal transduction histidine kinase [Kribbella orskensis]